MFSFKTYITFDMQKNHLHSPLYHFIPLSHDFNIKVQAHLLFGMDTNLLKV